MTLTSRLRDPAPRVPSLANMFVEFAPGAMLRDQEDLLLAVVELQELQDVGMVELDEVLDLLLQELHVAMNLHQKTSKNIKKQEKTSRNQSTS